MGHGSVMKERMRRELSQVRDGDLDTLIELGQRLDTRPEALKGASVRQFLAESLLKVRNKRGRTVRLRVNDAQKEFDHRAGARNIVLKARQVGMTTWVAARFFLDVITKPGTLAVQVAHDQSSAEEIFQIVHRFLEKLPEEIALRTGALKTSRANVRQIVFPELDSEYRVETAADPNAGRGLTIQRLHCSEVARWPRRAEETLAALRAAVPPEGEIVLESTPNGASGCFYREWQEAAGNGYVQHFFPWWMEPSYREPAAGEMSFSDEEKQLIDIHGLDAEQIAFRRRMRANFGEKADEEFAESAEECFISSSHAVFDTEKIRERALTVGGPLERRQNGRVCIYLPAAKREYVIGVDAAGGGASGDYACAQVLDLETGWQCAELYGRYSPVELARAVADLAREYNGALVAVEMNNHGHAVLATLVEVERYPRLYGDGGQVGWATTAATRPRMITLVGAMLSQRAEAVNSGRLLEECRTFVRDEKGREAAAQGAHDDAVMAMGVALAVREEVLRAGNRGQKALKIGD